MAVNANPLSDTVITDATIISAMLTGESSASVTASSIIDPAAARAMTRMGRRRADTTSPLRRSTASDQRPAPIRPPAPSSWADITSVPAEPGDQPRASISHTRVKVHTSTWGTTSSTDARWMRHSIDDPR